MDKNIVEYRRKHHRCRYCKYCSKLGDSMAYCDLKDKFICGWFCLENYRGKFCDYFEIG